MVIYIPPETEWEVKSKTNPDVTYLVSMDPNGRLTCNCPATRECWHIKFIKTMLSHGVKKIDEPYNERRRRPFSERRNSKNRT